MTENRYSADHSACSWGGMFVGHVNLYGSMFGHVNLFGLLGIAWQCPLCLGSSILKINSSPDK